MLMPHLRLGRSRPAAAIVEIAVLLPLLVFLFAIGVDFARIFYFAQILTDCARNGAVYGSSHPDRASDHEGIQQTALADAGNLVPAPTVASEVTTDADGYQCVRVTVSWSFTAMTNCPGVPSPYTLTRTVQMRVGSLWPKEN